jgi:hypothetical protein
VDSQRHCATAFADMSCLRSPGVKKSDDARAGNAGGGGGISTTSCVLMSLIALLAGMGLYTTVRARMSVGGGAGGDTLTSILGKVKGIVPGAAAAAPPPGMWVHPNRPLAMLDVDKWQWRNITQVRQAGGGGGGRGVDSLWRFGWTARKC